MRLGEVLNDYGHRLRTVMLHEGDELPPDLDDIDGIVTCGGSPSANDDSLEWLAPEMDMLKQAHAMELPVVGLCLGAQILCRALGGSVGPVEGGMQLGWEDVKLTDTGREDPIHSGIAWTSAQFHWNREAISDLPNGARTLASSDRCTVETWAYGLRTYGFQHHPEIRRATIDQWIADDKYALEEAGTTAEQLAEQTEQHFEHMQRLSTRLFTSIALLLMPVDRRYSGIVKELRH